MYKRKVSSIEEGQKIFKFLLRTTDATKIFLHKLFRKKKIYVNDKIVAKDYIIRKDDIIFSKELIQKEEKNLIYRPLEIIYEDKNIIAVDKKAKDSVYGEDDSIINSLKAYLQKNNKECNFIVPVHRLDRYTGGVLIFALNYKAAKILTALFRKQKVRKIYEGLLEGKINQTFFIEAKIEREKNESLSRISDIKIHNTIPLKNQWLKANPKKSATIIKPIKIIKDFTLCEIEIWTGQHHQIRAVCKEIGHPLVSDIKYGGRKITQLKHYLLNCKRIEIPLLNIKFESRISKKIEDLIKKLENL